MSRILIIISVVLSACVTTPERVEPKCETTPQACIESVLVDIDKTEGVFLFPVCIVFAHPRAPGFIPDEYLSFGFRVCYEV